MHTRFELRWHLGPTDAEEVEPELFPILQAIQEGGSLRVATQQVGLSYRHAWGLMQKWERLLGQPLAHLERGRGATLAPLGETLLWAQRRAAARLGPELESLASEIDRELGQVLAGGGTPTLMVYASHGLAVGVLRDLVNERHTVKMDLQFRGSLDSLRMLSAGRCDLAGFHLPEGELARRLAPRFRRWLHPKTQLLIHVVYREQGLMTLAGDPKGISRVEDLADRDVRFVNRQPGAGTRLILDQLLADAAIEPSAIKGYDTEEFTHMAVAAMVASGAADAGFGIEAAARQFGLRFVPVARERYFFALRREVLARPAVQDLLEVLRGQAFREQVAKLPGYDPSHAGAVLPVEELLPA